MKKIDFLKSKKTSVSQKTILVQKEKKGKKESFYKIEWSSMIFFSFFKEVIHELNYKEIRQWLNLEEAITGTKK